MRNSFESRLLNTFLVVLLLLASGRGVYGAYSWTDCGDKLGATITYQSVTISTDPIISGSTVAVNIAFTISENYIWGGNILTLYYNGFEMLNVTTTDACDLAPTEFSCPLKPRSVSYTDLWYIPSNLPSGIYTVLIHNVFGKGVFETPTGCLEISTQIVQTGSTTSTCNYESQASATLTAIQTPWVPGDYLQVGPVWPNNETATQSEWGRFTSLSASHDILMFGSWSDYSHLAWALNGTRTHQATLANNAVAHTYSGQFFVAYTGSKYPSLISEKDPVLSGTFNWTFTFPFGSNIPTLSGTVVVSPSDGYQPDGWPYPLSFGRIPVYTITSSGEGYSLTGQETINTCVSTSLPPINTNENLLSGGGDKSKYNPDQQWAIGLGVAGFLLVIGILVLLFVAWRQNRNRMYLNDDDLVDPLKPDYGSQAINDIIEDNTNLPRA